MKIRLSRSLSSQVRKLLVLYFSQIFITRPEIQETDSHAKFVLSKAHNLRSLTLDIVIQLSSVWSSHEHHTSLIMNHLPEKKNRFFSFTLLSIDQFISEQLLIL